MTASRVLIVGHRANSGRIVEFYRISKVTHVEIDVRQNGSEILVGHGKPVINRATPIGSLWAWLDYKLFWRDPLLKTRTLSEWFEVLTGKLRVEGVLLDLKNEVDPETLAMTIRESGFNGEVYVSVEDHRQIPRLKKELPQAKVLASYSIMPVDIVECTISSGADGVSLRKDYVTRSIVEQLHHSGLLVFAWTVNRRSDVLRVYEAGVDGIITDRPDIVRKTILSL